MRVPDDILFRPYEDRRRQTSANEQGTPPVDSSPASGDALARERRRAPLVRETPNDDKSQQNVPKEERRRQEDRRQRQQNVFLDTRSSSDRRRTSIYPSVKVKA